MFSLPISLPSQWEKRVVRYIISRFDFLEERTLGDLSNFEGSLGRNSVLTLKDVGIKVDRIKQLLDLPTPPRLRIDKAIIGTLTVTLPTNFLISGSIEVVISDVSVAVTVTPAAPPTPPPSPRKRPTTFCHGDSEDGGGDDDGGEEEGEEEIDDEEDDGEDDKHVTALPATAEDLAQSFLHSQPLEDQDQLLHSLYQDPLAASSATTTSSTEEDEEDGELGIGTSIGLPKILANVFKGVGDRLRLRVRGVTVSLETTAPEDQGGQKIILELELEDVDVEGITNTSPVGKGHDGGTSGGKARKQREGKRCITLDKINGYITSDASLFEPPSPPEASALFGVSSEVTERGMRQSMDTMMERHSAGNLAASAATIRSLSPPSPSPVTAIRGPLSPADQRNEYALAEDLDEGVQVGNEHGLVGSLFSDRGGFPEYEDASSDEELAFAPIQNTRTTRPSLQSFQPRPMAPTYDDEDSEDEGGAAFAPGTLFEDDDKPPIQFPFASVQYSSDAENNSSGDDEMDAETSRLLSESTLFTHSEAGSLYLSATSGILHGSIHLQRDEEMSRRKDAEDEEEVSGEEIDARLDKLLSTTIDPSALETAESAQSLLPGFEAGGCSEGGFRRVERRLRRKIFHLDTIEVFIPSLSDTPATASETANAPEGLAFATRDASHMTESADFQIPGAFSMYAARSSRTLGPKPATPPLSPPKAAGRKPAVRILDSRTPAPRPGSSHGEDRAPDIEILVGNAEADVDIVTTKVLGIVLEAVTGALAEEPVDEPKRKRKDANVNKAQTNGGTGLNLSVIVKEVGLRLVENLPGVYIHEGEGEEKRRDVVDDAIIMELILQKITITHKSLAEKITTSKIDIKKFSLGNGKTDYLSFIRPPASTAKSKRRASHPPLAPNTTPESDMTFIISQSPSKKRINILTLPLKVHLDLLGLEETLRSFGGFGGVLASTTSSTATITKVRSSELPTRGGSPQEVPIVVDTKVDCRVRGLMVEVVGATAKIGLETSPLKIRSESGDHSSVSVSVDKISIYGPNVPWDSPHEPIAASILVENTRVEFLGTPEQEDLGRLLELLTPSKDRFETDDDILIDTLLRQREQGSLLRIGVGTVKVEVGDLGITKKLKELGAEVMKVLTVTDLVAQDERPGLLTLLNVDSFYAKADFGGGVGLLESQMGGIGIAHVSVPSLVALAVVKIIVRRNGEEELVGAGLERRMFDKADEGRPMAMVRIVGDDPEPVIKLKLWNLRAEYKVETLMSFMSTPENASAEILAQEMVQSIVNLAQERSDSIQTPPLGLDIAIQDCVIGLNPLNLSSRGLIVLTDSRLQAALPSGGTLSAGLEIKKASIMLVDDVANLVLSTERREPRRRSHVVGRPLAGYTAMGYVSVITISSAKATLCVVEMGGSNGEKAVDLDVRDDLLLIESCADSTQTLVGIVNGLKPPLPEEDEVKYCTEVMPIDMLRSLTEDAFVHPSRRKADDPGFRMDDDDGDMVGDDVPLNLAFVESYYGHPNSSGSLGASAYTKDEIADSMLDEDLGKIAPGPSKPLRAGQKGMMASFTEQVHVLDESPIEIVDEYFRGPDPVKRRTTSFTGKRLNREAVNKWDSFRKRYVPSNCMDGRTRRFPLRIKVRDVHIIWNLHDGYDWQRTRDTINQAVKRIEYKALERRNNRRVSFDVDDEEESVIGDFLFNSIYIGVPANRDPRDLSSAINKNFDDHISETSFASSALESRPSSNSRNTEFGGGIRGSGKNLKLSRSRSHKMQFELKGVCVDFLLFPPDMGETQSSIDLRVRDLEIFDNVPTSTWKKFVTYMQDAGVRETGSNMVHLEIMNVKPVPELAASEIVLRVTVLPLRLHVDQDTLDFLTRFFEFKDDTVLPSNTPAEIPFLQRVEVNAIRVKLDYKPKKVDYAGLRSGHTTEFMNFFILEEADMVLRRVILYGISGFPRMGVELNATWTPDIRQTQLGDVLAGVAPVRSLVNLGGGVKDLVVVPMREYKKDGRIVRSLQKGAWKFAKTTTSELVRLGAKVAVGTQNVLQNAEGFLVPAILDDGMEGAEYLISDSEEEGDMVGPSEHGQKKAISLYADQPLSVVQGLRGAGDSLRRNFGSARDAIMAVPVDIAEQGSAQGAAKAVARAAPVAIIRPMIGATEAVSRTLLGVTNALDPDQKRRVDDKYKKH